MSKSGPKSISVKGVYQIRAADKKVNRMRRTRRYGENTKVVL